MGRDGSASRIRNDWFARSSARYADNADFAGCSQTRMMDVACMMPPPPPRPPRRLPQRSSHERGADCLLIRHLTPNDDSSDDESLDGKQGWWKLLTQESKVSPLSSPRGFPSVLDIDPFLMTHADSETSRFGDKRPEVDTGSGNFFACCIRR
mmetsp:Transcript_61866/g.98021  ORF Transcript_61866/g.98021 Transcript_61866/m.98021 type:complete len:152 (-) Transcript_61866:203-658(-)